MLIEFKVANFRSIREEQTLSLVAANADKTLPSRVIEPKLPGLSKIKLLKGAALYGANASGKSNVIDAIRFVSNFVKTSVTKLQPGDPTGTQPFKLDRESIDKPSEFEVTFVAKGVRYLFGLLVTPERVIEEYLFAYPKGAQQRWYHRTYDEESGSYEWAKPSTAFKGSKDLQDKTRDNSLFLSVGPQFNHPQLSLVFDWFRHNLHFFHLDALSLMYQEITAKRLKMPNRDTRVLNLLRNSDIGIVDANISIKAFSLEEMIADFPPSIVREIREDPKEERINHVEIHLCHETQNMEPVALDFNMEESTGTRAFFGLVGPWLELIDNGHTVLIDEIETSLHPLLLKELFELIFGEANTKGAQVIFTTHNPVLLDNTLMRRDQVWFTEKSSKGTTSLYPLTDYKPRGKEARLKGYLAGRYGAIPFIPDGLKP